MEDLGQRFNLEDLQVGDFMQHGRHSVEIYEILDINLSDRQTMIRRINRNAEDAFGYSLDRFNNDRMWRRLSNPASRPMSRFVSIAKALINCEEHQGETQASLHEILMRLEV